MDVVIYRGTVLSYALEAEGFFEINTWGINDTEHFAIDNQGVITNTRVLDEGEYGLQIDVTDTQGNVLSGAIRVTVLPGPIPPLPPFSLVQILVFIVVLDIIMVVFLILFIRYKRHLFL